MWSGKPSASMENLTELEKVESGEENEKRAFPPTRCKLFQLEDGKAWKERGVGKVCVNVRKDNEAKSRILFRTERVGMVRLNANIFPEMRVEKAGEKGVKIVAVDGEGKPESYYIKFARPSEAQTLLSVLKERKDKQSVTSDSSPSPRPAPSSSSSSSSSSLSPATAPASSTLMASREKPKAKAVCLCYVLHTYTYICTVTHSLSVCLSLSCTLTHTHTHTHIPRVEVAATADTPMAGVTQLVNVDPVRSGGEVPH